LERLSALAPSRLFLLMPEEYHSQLHAIIGTSNARGVTATTIGTIAIFIVSIAPHILSGIAVIAFGCRLDGSSYTAERVP
jgi:hypothetical protein